MLLPDLAPPHHRPVEQRRRQQRIAEIAELIHVASLLHDDVLDDAETRRGILSLNAQSGNKLAILAGDFLLARASVTLASLQNTGLCGCGMVLDLKGLLSLWVQLWACAAGQGAQLPEFN